MSAIQTTPDKPPGKRCKRWLPAVVVMTLVGCERESGSDSSSQSEAGSQTKSLTIFAAASTTDVLREAGRRFESATGTEVTFSFDSSSNLAKQIKMGAPADIFISADEAWMDDVAAARAIQPATRQDLLGNDLVMIAPLDKGFEATMSPEFDFAASLPQVRRMAVGDASHVAAGRYARQALESLDWWSGLEPLLLPALDVRAALRLVELGEADAGIVYSTDARQSDKVVVVAVFPSSLHDPIRYPIALCQGAAPAAEDFLHFLRTPESARMFEDAGFRVLATGAPEDEG